MDTLTESDVPSPDADWETISNFAILYDGYEACGSIEACAEIAKAQKHDTLENLRICLFYEERKWRWQEEEPDERSRRYIYSLVEKIRAFVKASSSSLNDNLRSVAKMSTAEVTNQIVYVLTNSSMPNLIKIGKTTQQEVEVRMKQLYGTGVPVPFECVFACQVKDATEVEKALHIAFGNTRINPNREFFEIEPERVIAVLKLLKTNDITTEFEKKLESDILAADMQSAQNLKEARRPRMNFHTIGIPNGSEIIFKDGQTKATVTDEKSIDFNGVSCSLLAATRQILGLPNDYPLQPSRYWAFNNKLIKDIYDDFYDVND